MPAQLQEEVQLLEKRMARLERLVQTLCEKLDMAPPEDGWWGGGGPEGDPASLAPSEQVMELIREGKKLQAVKLHHQQSGLGLAEAQAAVERYEGKGG